MNQSDPAIMNPKNGRAHVLKGSECDSHVESIGTFCGALDDAHLLDDRRDNLHPHHLGGGWENHRGKSR